jgi:pilus assembly protein CpaB
MSRNFGGFNQARQAERTRLLVVLVGLLFAVIAGGVLILVFSYGKESSGMAPTAVVVQKEQAEIRQVNVLIPIRDIDAGTELLPQLFRNESRPELGTSPRAVKSLDEIKGMYARSMVVHGEPLVADLMTPVRPTNAITANIPPGYRAVTISVTATSSVEGWALPGARVDVVWASKIRGQAGVTVIVQNAKILSAEKNIDPNAKPGAPVPSTVTLLVTADEATKIQLAQTSGALSLSLRGDSETGKAVSGNLGGGGSLTVDDLLSGGKPLNDQRRKNPISIKVRDKDGKLEEMVFEEGKLVPLSKPEASE